MSAALCKESVNRGYGRWSNFQPCGRPAKDDGLCGIHLAAMRRRAERDLAYIAKRDRNATLQDRADELAQKLGVDVSAYYDSLGPGLGHYTDDIVIGYDDLLRLVERDA